MVVSKAEFEQMKVELNASFAKLVERIDALEAAQKAAPRKATRTKATGDEDTEK